jgi:hypothetical protein
MLAVILTIAGTFAVNTLQELRSPDRLQVVSDFPAGVAVAAALTGANPQPSGHGPADGPWATSAAVILVPATGGQPCTDPVMFVPDITQWTVPPGCYGNIYRPNPANYPPRPGFGWCNWWVRVLHPNHPDITENKSYPEGGDPHPGDAVFFFGYEQGADAAGHWAQVVAVAPDHYWVLISEMNFAWRGAGWSRVDYRYIHVSPRVIFVYA